MKKIRVLFIALFAAVLCLSLAAFAACGGESKPTAAKATLTLDPSEGGALEQTSYEVEAGASIAEFVENIAPAPEEGLTFAGWYLSGDPLAAQTMPENGATLTAKYKARYTLSVYYESAEGEYGEAETTTGEAFYGEPFTCSPEGKEHFALDTNKTNALSSQSLGKHEEFSAYYARELLNVYYYANAPEDSGIEEVFPAELSRRYGESFTLPDGGLADLPEQFRLAGWSTQADGEAEYRAGAAFTVEETTFLYAVWDEAYYDRYGGGDLLFLPQMEENSAYLVRAGEEYRGEREGNAFLFRDGEKELLKGKTFADGTFVYFREADTDATYLHADPYRSDLHEDGATLVFDGLGGATYRAGAEVLEGTILYDPETELYTFLDGDGGSYFQFMLTVLTDGETNENVFVSVGEEAGVYYDFEFYYDPEAAEPIQAYSPYVLYLDGMGSALVLDPDLAELWFYGRYEPTENGGLDLTLVDSEGQTFSEKGRLMVYGEAPIFVRDLSLGGEYRDNGGTLVLDDCSGTFQSAEYTPAGAQKKTGMYLLEDSPLGDIVRFVEEDGTVTAFRIDAENRSFRVLGGADYAEYHYYYGAASSGGLGSTTIVFGENDKATYYYGAEAIEGSATRVEGKDGFFLFVSGQGNLVFEFEIGGDYFPSGLYTHYHRYFKQYPTLQTAGAVKLESENGTLLLSPVDEEGVPQGFALYTSGGVSRLGAWQFFSKEEFAVGFDFVEFLDITTGEYFFFRIDGESGARVFSALGEETNVYSLYENGATDYNILLFLFADETHPAIYVDPEYPKDFYGEYTYDKETGEGAFSGKSGSETISFSFLLVETEEGLCFAIHTDLWTGAKQFRNGEHTLVLDGYGFAEYDGMEAQYYLVGRLEAQNAYRFYVYGTEMGQDFEGWFDVDLAANSYTACGYEAGQYNADDGSGDVFLFDGYGKVTRYNIAFRESDGITLTPLEEGTYAFVDTEEEILRVTFEKDEFLVHIWASFDGEEYTEYFTVEFKGAGTYKSSDLELLSLNPFGEAIFTDKYGITYQGDYTRLSENAVSFTADSLEEQIFVLGENNALSHPTEGFVTDGDTLVKYLGGTDKEIAIPKGIEKIAPLAFSVHEYGSRYRGADIVSVDLSDATEIGANAFNGCADLRSAIGNKVKTVGANAFYACISLETVSLPAAETVGENAFRLCESLVSVRLEKAKTLYSSAFSGCSSLRTADLPAAEKLYEGVFYDCFLLETATLGENLAQLGTPEEPVAGVFGRSAGFEQSPLTVVLQGNTAPVVGYDLFEGVEIYTVLVNDLATVKAFYLNEGWEAYNGYVGAQSSFDGTYYRYNYGVTAFVLNGLLREINYSVEVLGAYGVENNTLTIVKFNPYAENKYTEKQAAVILDGDSFLYDRYGYGLDGGYENLHLYTKAGKETIFKVDGTEDTLAFTPAAGNLFAAGVAYEVPAVHTASGQPKNAAVRLVLDQYYSSSLYLVEDGYRYELTPNANATSATVTIGYKAFDPVVRFYSAEDGSYLAVSQNNEEETDFTVSCVLTGITEEDGSPFVLAQAPVKKDGDGAFTTLSSYVCNGYAYSITFLVGGDGFTYRYEREKEYSFTDLAQTVRILLYRNAAGETTNVQLYLLRGDSWQKADDLTQNYSHTESGNAHRWTVYEYNYACDVTLTLSEEGDELTETVSAKTVVKGYLDGVYAIAFYDGTVRDSLWMRNREGRYEQISADKIDEKEGYLSVLFDGATYYVSLDVDSGAASVVFADMTYESSEWDDLQGSVRVKRRPDGSIESMTLTVEDKTFTQFTEREGDYGPYYVFKGDGEYYLAELSSSGCSIYALQEKNYFHEATQFALSVLVRANGVAAEVLSATYRGENVADKISYSAVTRAGEDYLYVVLPTESGTIAYLAEIATSSIETLEEITVATEDGQYRLTLVVTESGMIYGATKFEISENGSYSEKTISWYGSANGDDRNYEIDVGSDFYYFNIVKTDEGWTATFAELVS